MERKTAKESTFMIQTNIFMKVHGSKMNVMET